MDVSPYDTPNLLSLVYLPESCRRLGVLLEVLLLLIIKDSLLLKTWSSPWFLYSHASHIPLDHTPKSLVSVDTLGLCRRTHLFKFTFKIFTRRSVCVTQTPHTSRDPGRQSYPTRNTEEDGTV